MMMEDLQWHCDQYMGGGRSMVACLLVRPAMTEMSGMLMISMRCRSSKDYVPSQKELGMSIHNAAKMGSEDTIDLLIRHGADPSDADMPMEFTPIMVAASKGHVHAMLLLIDRCATLHPCTYASVRPTHHPLHARKQWECDGSIVSSCHQDSPRIAASDGRVGTPGGGGSTTSTRWGKLRSTSGACGGTRTLSRRLLPRGQRRGTRTSMGGRLMTARRWTRRSTGCAAM